MTSKYQTLQTIYELVKEDTHPTLLSFTPGAIILRQAIPWDEIVAHLNELEEEGLVQIRQFNTAAISITDAGIAQASSLLTVKAA